MPVFALQLIAFILFGVDKAKAIRHRWRVSEACLLLFSVFGGIGALLGMLLFHHKTRKWKFRILVPLFALLDAVVIAFFLWTAVYYHADDRAAAAMQSDDTVTVAKTDTGWLFDGPSQENALIFYPGGKVEETAYAPLLHVLAEETADVYLVRMPLHLAFFGMKKAGRIVEHSAYSHYFIGGHSLGGAMAAMYTEDHGSTFDGQILLAAYPVKETALDTLLIYGSEDGVINRERVKEVPSLVTGTYDELVIQGANHAQFGNYGRQSGDGQAGIPAQQQQEKTVEKIREFMNR